MEFSRTSVDALDEYHDEAIAVSTPTWPLYAVLFSSACIVIGIIWDISWHSTIGRDTFWTLPHLLEQLGAIVAGVSCGSLVLYTTFEAPKDRRAAGVRFWGFHGPLGGWVTIWGTLVMIASAPFDNWWHNAYGLDVKIVSPPHMVLALGMIAIEVGAILLALAAQNRATDAETVHRTGWAYALAGGILLTMVATLVTEYASRPNDMHNPLFYQVAAGVFPVFLAAFTRSGRLTYPATTAAVIYMTIVLAMIWILQLFPAQPLLAPIYRPITHMVPPQFPLLLVVPALAVDLSARRRAGRSDWLLAVITGVAFVGLLLAVQWFFAEFLLSPHARTFFFGADQWPYFVEPGAWQYRFWNMPKDAAGHVSSTAMVHGLGIAALIAVCSSRIGIWWGNGMSRVLR